VIAEELNVPAGTVRGWLRRVSDRAAQLRCTATRQLFELDPTAAAPGPTGSALGDALGALTAAVDAARRRLGRDTPGLVWALIGAARATAAPTTRPRRMINIGGTGLARAREPPTP
jgi:hypothetical protein